MGYRPNGVVRAAGVVRRAPSAQLLTAVACYFVIQVEAGDDPLSVRAVPDGCADLLFDLGPSGPVVYRGRARSLAATFVHRGPALLIGAQLFPGVIRLCDGLDLGALGRKLHALPSVDQRVAELDRALELHLSGRRLDPRVARALELLAAAKGAISVEQLAHHASTSPRNLQRLFGHWVGLQPKRFGRILRFQGVLAEVEQGRSIDWAALAAELGYADQSHLIRDVAAFSGLSPSRLRGD